MNYRLRVDDAHFDYLKLQKGSLDRWKEDRAEWHRRYESAIYDDFEGLSPWLPEECWGLLDIGSGLGGIDALIYRYYADRSSRPFVHLMDGINDPPELRLHCQTFNNATVAADFQVKNGVPSGRVCCMPIDETIAHPFDLILSLGSWCFHYPPSTYLPYVKRCAHRDFILIVDVRAGRPEYDRQLAEHFESAAVIGAWPKFERRVYRLRT